MYVVLPFHVLTPHKFLEKHQACVHHNMCSTKHKSQNPTHRGLKDEVFVWRLWSGSLIFFETSISAESNEAYKGPHLIRRLQSVSTEVAFKVSFSFVHPSTLHVCPPVTFIAHHLCFSCTWRWVFFIAVQTVRITTVSSIECCTTCSLSLFLDRLVGKADDSLGFRTFSSLEFFL